MYSTLCAIVRYAHSFNANAALYAAFYQFVSRLWSYSALKQCCQAPR